MSATNFSQMTNIQSIVVSLSSQSFVWNDCGETMNEFNLVFDNRITSVTPGYNRFTSDYVATMNNSI